MNMGFKTCPKCNGTGCVGTNMEMCDMCHGQGIAMLPDTNFDMLTEDLFVLGRYLAKAIPPYAYPKEVRDIWYSYPPGENKAYEMAWQEWLGRPVTKKLV